MAAQKKTGAVVMQTFQTGMSETSLTTSTVVWTPEGFVQLTNLDHKGVEVPEVLVHPHTSRVAQDLINTAGDHAAHEPPLVPYQADQDVDEHGHPERGQEGGVGGQPRNVGIDAELGTADFEGTVCIWPEGVIGTVTGIIGGVANEWQRALDQVGHDFWSVVLVNIRQSLTRLEIH